MAESSRNKKSGNNISWNFGPTGPYLCVEHMPKNKVDLCHCKELLIDALRLKSILQRVTTH